MWSDVVAGPGRRWLESAAEIPHLDSRKGADGNVRFTRDALDVLVLTCTLKPPAVRRARRPSIAERKPQLAPFRRPKIPQVANPVEETSMPSDRPLWHVSERVLARGDIIPAGRWGAICLAQGATASPLYYREVLLDLVRFQHTEIKISRLSCAFAFDDLDLAHRWASTRPGEFVYEVEPVDAGAVRHRGDMLWLTWMGEPGRSADRIVADAIAYWAGEATTAVVPDQDIEGWEWLISSNLRIVGQVNPAM